jgi:hypothetical protein
VAIDAIGGPKVIQKHQVSNSAKWLLLIDKLRTNFNVLRDIDPARNAQVREYSLCLLAIWRRSAGHVIIVLANLPEPGVEGR